MKLSTYFNTSITLFGILLFVLFSMPKVYGQGETNNWYFGNNAGLNFSSGEPIALTDGQLDTAEGCASISNSLGELLFYTDGITVWNRNHVIMQNGENLNGDFSSTNSAIIVPNPINNNIYYIFTVDVPTGPNGLQYSEVDITLDAGLGGITTTKNIPLDPFTTEKLTAVQKNNINEFWVVSHRLDSNEFISFSVDSNGVNTTPVVSAVGTIVNNVDQGSSQGQMKISPDGTKLALGRGDAAIGLFLYDFDSTSGIVSNEQIIFTPPPPPPSINQNVYGIEFSPSSQFLYSIYFEGGNELSVVYQYDTLAGSATDILNSEVELLRDFVGLLGSLQLASNGKIYFADFFSSNIGVINFPDEPGINADIVNEAISLQGRTAVLGLPPFIQSYFVTNINFSNTCFGDSTTFTLSDTADTTLWNFDDPASGTNNTSNLADPTHIFSSPGFYNVSAEITFQSITSIFETVVEIFPIPTTTTLPNQISCDDNADGFGTFDTATIDQELLNGQTGISISYVDSSGNPLSSPLPNPYTNGIINQEDILATLTNDTTGCTNTTTITFQVVDPPTVDDTIDLFACDDDLDGFAPFNTSNVENNLILGNTTLTVTYVDGNGNPLSSPLPNPLQNVIANNEIIMATITDPVTNCTSSAVINLTIVGEPQITPVTTFGICDTDDDGDDTNGFVIFNLVSKEAEILNGQTNITVTYYESQNDLDNNIPIPDPSNYYSDNTTIFISLANTDATGNCSAQTTFDLEVFEKPTINPGPILLAQCDLNQDGFAPFNLTEAEVLLSPNYQLETFTYSDTSGNPIADPTSYTNTIINNETINVTVTSVEGCFRETSFLLEVDTSQIPDTFLLDFFSCSPTGNGIATFDFSSATALLLNEFPAGQMLTVNYYETQQEAELELNPIADPSDYSNNPLFTNNNIQDIWVRVDGDTANDCRGLGIHVQLNVNPNPTFLPTITPLEECSPIANAFTFDLTQKDAEITGGNPDYVVTYYESIGAYTATPPIAIGNATAFPNSSNPQTIFYSLEDTTTGCTTFDPAMNFELVVNQNPVLTNPTELQVCDDDGVADGFTTVDLSVKDIEITGGFDSNLTITYHLTAAGATAGDASIPDKTMFTITANPQIVVARVTDNTTACFSTVNLSVRTFPVPVPVVPADYEECDDDNDGVLDFFVLSSRDAEITGGDPTLTVAYYLTQADAENAPAGQELDNMMYINNDPFEQIVFARVFNGAGCFATVPLTLRVLNTPMPNETPDDYPLCDDNADGLQIFDLTSQELNILGTLDPATHTVVWFPSLVAAQNGTPQIGSPAAYTSNTATVFAVVTDTAQPTTTNTFCSNIAALELIVNPLPTPIQPAEYELCDDLESGSDVDEFSTFDLRSRDDEITGGNDDWAVSYHLTQADADAGTPELADLYQNEVMANQTIFARVEDIVTGCFDTITLTLVVNPLPSPTTIAAVEECDTMANDGDADNDGDAVFDLTGQVTTDIINGETFMALTFHETIASAELGTPAIANPAAYETVSRTIFVRATDTDPATGTECFRIVELELIVQPAPVLPAVIPDLTECDDDEDGQALFDLTQNDAIVYGTQNPVDFNLTYHETLASAEAMVGSMADMPIADPVNYLSSAPTTQVWVRLEDGTTGCTVIGTFDLNIAMIPTITPPGVLEACDSEGVLVGTDDDGITTFDLTSLNAGITGGDPTLSVSYYESQADLDGGTAAAITTPDAYVNNGMNPQTIFILVTSDQAGMCGAQTTVYLQVNPLPVIGEPLPPAIACDEDNDGFGEFDLQQYNDDLLIPLVNIDLRFYETLDNTQADTGAGQIDITVPYNNITGMTTLFVVAQDTDPVTATSCTKIYEFELIVFPIPELPATLDTLTECDEDNNLTEIIDLTQNEVAIFGAQDPTTLVISYHNTFADADAGNNPILDPANYNATQITPLEVIWVRLQVNDGSPNNCAAIGSFEISVETPPTANPAGDDLSLMICDDDTDTFNVFDLTVNEANLTGGDALLTVTYYESLAAQTADTPIADPTAYANILNPQTIQAVVSSAAGCTDQTTFDIEVLPLPTPNVNPDPLELCDDDSDGDSANGLTTFDLTAAITQIGGGEPVDILVYTDLAFAEANPDDPTQAIPDVTAFINTVPGNQTLFARVERNVPGDSDLDNDGNLCFVIVPFEVVVNPLPILAEAGPINYTFCEEFDGDDTMGSLDLITLADEVGILSAPQITADFIISYHNLLVQAEANTAPLSTPYTVADGEEIFVRIENATTGCVNFTSIIFTVESRPEVFPADNIVQCADDLGINTVPNQDEATFDLTQQNVVITGNEPSTSVTYYTSLADAEMMINAIDTPSAFVNTSNPQTIFARAVNTTSGCESTDVINFEIFVQPLPYTDLTNEGGQICVDEITGEALDPFTIDGTVESPQIGVTYTYAWTQDGALISLDPVVTVDAAGVYQVLVTATYIDGTQCDYIAEAVYTAESAPVFEAIVVESSFNSSGLYTVEVINVTGADLSSEYEFALDNGPFQSSHTFTNVTPGTHTIFGRLASGNCSISEFEIGIIDYPRFFTPNADGFHDTWNIIGLGVAPNLNAKIFIFDRYGKLLKQISPLGAGWDGTFNGQPMPSNDYWFRVEFTEVDEVGTQRTVNGHFTLKR